MVAQREEFISCEQAVRVAIIVTKRLEGAPVKVWDAAQLPELCLWPIVILQSLPKDGVYKWRHRPRLKDWPSAAVKGEQLYRGPKLFQVEEDVVVRRTGRRAPVPKHLSARSGSRQGAGGRSKQRGSETANNGGVGSISKHPSSLLNDAADCNKDEGEMIITCIYD